MKEIVQSVEVQIVAKNLFVNTITTWKNVCIDRSTVLTKY